MNDDLLEVELEPLEREVLTRGLTEWGGPARCTNELAIAMGFTGLHDFWSDCDRLRTALHEGRAMTTMDWARACLATEVVFVSDFVGSGRDWSITTGISDDDTLRTIRTIQRKLTRYLRPIVGTHFGTRPG